MNNYTKSTFHETKKRNKIAPLFKPKQKTNQL